MKFDDFALTGAFPNPGEVLPRGDMTLVTCSGCGLVQLLEQYDLEELYGENYGYRSGLNNSMAEHLRRIAYKLTPNLSVGDIALDIGSNDGTLLHWHPIGVIPIGFDPTAAKFSEYYPPAAIPVPVFFDADAFLTLTEGRQAKVITSIAMFYDLPDPVQFAKDVARCLTDDGVWYLEQLYLPTMLKNCAYDSICQEHVEYYGMQQLKRIMDEAGLFIREVEGNGVNGGSIALTVTKDPHAEKFVTDPLVDFDDFVRRVKEHPAKLRAVLESCERVAGFGASTKGNVLLQHCNLTSDDIIAVADVNKEKWGKVTATGIPIMDDTNVAALKPSHYLVLPWHFRNDILTRYKGTGTKFIFPLPEPEVVVA